MDESAARAAPRSDAELITAVASGDTAAQGVLRERHRAAARSLAGLLSADPAEAEEITADAFAGLLHEIRERSGPAVALRPHLFLAVRWAAYRRWPVQQAATMGEPAGPGPAGPAPAGTARAADTAQEPQEPMFAAPALADMVRSPLNGAFLSRPQRSCAVLWHLDVEQIGPAETAAILGLTQDGVFEFAAEARAGLRQSYLSQYVAGTARADCASAMATLGTRAEGQLTGLDEPTVAQHLGACRYCQAAAGDLSDLGESLRRVVAPIYLGAAAAAYLQASLGGLHWTRERPRTTGTARQPSRRLLAAACGLLAAGAATGLALTLTATASPPQHTAAQDRPAAVTRPSGSPAAAPTAPPDSPPTGRAPGSGLSGSSGTATSPSPAPASPSPSPVATSPGSPLTAANCAAAHAHAYPAPPPALSSVPVTPSSSITAPSPAPGGGSASASARLAWLRNSPRFGADKSMILRKYV
jgi:DNA-directed RNA polymerase specialized sigma24 family protein